MISRSLRWFLNMLYILLERCWKVWSSTPIQSLVLHFPEGSTYSRYWSLKLLRNKEQSDTESVSRIIKKGGFCVLRAKKLFQFRVLQNMPLRQQRRREESESASAHCLKYTNEKQTLQHSSVHAQLLFELDCWGNNLNGARFLSEEAAVYLVIESGHQMLSKTSCNLRYNLHRTHNIFDVLRRNAATSRAHKERRLVKFSNEELYQVVSHVESYHKFVPWCIGSNILRSSPTNLEAELVVGYGIFNEKYISDVELKYPSSIVAVSKQTNLLEYMTTKWSFSPCSSNPRHCWVIFEVDFKFKSPLYNQISDMFLQDIINSMVSAFEGRCRKEFCHLEKEKKRGSDTCNWRSAKCNPYLFNLSEDNIGHEVSFKCHRCSNLLITTQSRIFLMEWHGD